MEHLPLALAQAAAFIEEQSITVGKYLDLLKDSDQAVVDLLSEDPDKVGLDSETPRAIVEAWIISFEQIQSQNTLAAELLSLMCCYDRQAIAAEFLETYRDSRQSSKRQAIAAMLLETFTKRSNKTQAIAAKFLERFSTSSSESRGDMDLVKALGCLKAFCLITEAKDETFDMHRLVQLVTRKWLVRNWAMHRFAGHSLLVLAVCYLYGRYKNWAVCMMYLPHVYAVLKFEGTISEVKMVSKARLLGNVSKYLKSQGEYGEAEKHLLSAIQLRDQVLGLNDPGCLTYMANLASIYYHQGRWEEAEKLNMEVMEISKTKLGEDHPNTLTCMSDLASTYDRQGRWEEAEKLNVEVMEISKTKLGPVHPDTLMSISNLASTYMNQRRWEEAEKLNIEVIEKRRTKLGADHPDTLTSKNNLASTLYRQGRVEDALVLMEECVNLQEEKLGRSHPHTRSSIERLKAWRAEHDSGS